MWLGVMNWAEAGGLDVEQDAEALHAREHDHRQPRVGHEPEHDEQHAFDNEGPLGHLREPVAAADPARQEPEGGHSDRAGGVDECGLRVRRSKLHIGEQDDLMTTARSRSTVIISRLRSSRSA